MQLYTSHITYKYLDDYLGTRQCQKLIQKTKRQQLKAY